MRHYKPDREVYQSAADILDLQPADVMMVAAHLGDLRAAKAVGLQTAFVARPLEYGPDGKPDLKGDASVDLSAKDFNDLARQLRDRRRLAACRIGDRSRAESPAIRYATPLSARGCS